MSQPSLLYISGRIESDARSLFGFSQYLSNPRYETEATRAAANDVLMNMRPALHSMLRAFEIMGVNVPPQFQLLLNRSGLTAANIALINTNTPDLGIIRVNVQVNQPVPAIPARPSVPVAPSRHQAAKEDNIKTVVKVIKISELNSTLPDNCGICFEHHKKGESYSCNCGHVFGKRCFDEWKNTCLRNWRDPSCPTCRARTTIVTSYRQRAARKQKVRTLL